MSHYQQEQIGQRASHFTVGSNPENQFKTTSQQSFNNQPKDRKQFPIIKKANNDDQIGNSKQNLRESHFQLGNQYEQGKLYNTTNNRIYGFHKDAESAGLSEDKKKDLRTHHFNFGGYALTTKTMNAINYISKPFSSNLQQDQDTQKQKMRGHHHDFKEMPNLIMTSKYNDEFNKQINKNDLQYVPHSEILQKGMEIRNSHIILGKETIPFQTIQQKDYQQKQIEQGIHKKIDFQGTHFNLGVQKDELCSTNDVFHFQQPMLKAKLPQATLNDLRSSHFNLGEQGNSYQSEFLDHYNRVSTKEQQLLKTKPNTNELQKAHFKIGDDIPYQSCYQTAYTQNLRKPINFLLTKQVDSKEDRSSHFQLGGEQKIYQSEMTQNFINPHGKANELEHAVKQTLRSSHFGFNDIPLNSFQTTQKATFSVQDMAKAKSKLDPIIEKDLRSHHFGFGQTIPVYQSAQHDIHKNPGKQEPGHLNKELANDLRTHHFKIA